MDTHPPFRAEHIGSLLRPAGLLALRQKFNRGEIDQHELAAAENRAIEEAVTLQQRLGSSSQPTASSGGAPITAISMLS
jgi:5-methyltetrahydropteroyltriglutamate--homocysteine methyltransferase